MNDSKNLAMMFLLGAFLTGGVLGFTADRFMNRGRVCTSSNSSVAVMDMMTERLHLSGEQRRTIDSILDHRGKQYRVVMEPIRPRLDSIKEDARDQMRRILSQEQKGEFEALIMELSDTTRKRNE
jgi:hypothetical protein